METKIDCIFCGKPQHLYINQEKEVYYCFRCGKSGHLRELREEQIVKAFSLMGVNLSGYDHPKKNLIPLKEFKEKLEDLSIYNREHNHIFNYAKKRGALKFVSSLFYHSQFPEYLIIGLPLNSTKESMTSFFGRKIIGEGIRYRFLTPCLKGVLVKSFKDQDKLIKRGVIVEGFFDLCKTSAYLPTIALLGTNIKSKLKEILNLPFQMYYIFLDWDAISIGIELSFKLGQVGKDSKIIHVYNDPDELEDFHLRKLLE